MPTAGDIEAWRAHGKQYRGVIEARGVAGDSQVRVAWCRCREKGGLGSPRVASSTAHTTSSGLRYLVGAISAAPRESSGGILSVHSLAVLAHRRPGVVPGETRCRGRSTCLPCAGAQCHFEPVHTGHLDCVCVTAKQPVNSGYWTCRYGNNTHGHGCAGAGKLKREQKYRGLL